MQPKIYQICPRWELVKTEAEKGVWFFFFPFFCWVLLFGAIILGGGQGKSPIWDQWAKLLFLVFYCCCVLFVFFWHSWAVMMLPKCHYGGKKHGFGSPALPNTCFRGKTFISMDGTESTVGFAQCPQCVPLKWEQNQAVFSFLKRKKFFLFCYFCDFVFPRRLRVGSINKSWAPTRVLQPTHDEK